MHHPDSAGDSPSPRKMAHPAIVPRRGNVCNPSSGTTSALSTVTCSTLSNNPLPADEYHSVIQPHPLPVSSTPGSQQPPHSLNIHPQSTVQPQILPSSGAQMMKKKSGFQITSVTPAQISVSTNNSITEDTESCDDLDESHTEDLSSSEILDVSLSRTNDKGAPERSSSEETLNNFHEAETPGAVSPNQPPLHHSLTQTHPQGTLMNGTVHHHHHHQDAHYHHHYQHIHANAASSASIISAQSGFPAVAAVSTAVTSSSGALPSVAQKMPLNVGGILENASASATGVMGQRSAASASVTGAIAGAFSAVSGAPICNVSSNNVNHVSTLSSACVPVVGGISASTSTSNVVFSTGLMNSSSNQNVNLIQQQHQHCGMTGAGAHGVLGRSNSGLTGVSGAVQPVTTGTPVPVSHTQQQQQPAPAATSSRFRVVKLDSNSEPFKKGRWTCTEYYDKETTSSTFASASAASMVPLENPINHSVETVRQFVSENATVAGSERDDVSLSSSSVSSSVSTLSHYSESVGSGEVGGHSVLHQTFQQQQQQQQQQPPPFKPMIQQHPPPFNICSSPPPKGPQSSTL